MLRKILETQSLAWKQIGVESASILPDFVLLRADCETNEVIPHQDLGTPKECFVNAGKIASSSKRYFYVEGFTCSKALPFPIHHAWLLDVETGQYEDPTLRDSEGRDYLGIVFDHTTLLTEITRTGYWGLLDTGRGINLELIYKLAPELKDAA